MQATKEMGYGFYLWSTIHVVHCDGELKSFFVLKYLKINFLYFYFNINISKLSKTNTKKVII